MSPHACKYLINPPSHSSSCCCSLGGLSFVPFSKQLDPHVDRQLWQRVLWGRGLWYDFLHGASELPPGLTTPSTSLCEARYKYMLIGGLAPCHNTLQTAFVQDKIKRLDAILKSIRKQERTEKMELRLSTRKSRKMTWLESQFISLSVKGNQFLSEIGRQFKHFYSFTKVWKFPVKEWGFFLLLFLHVWHFHPTFRGHHQKISLKGEPAIRMWEIVY